MTVKIINFQVSLRVIVAVLQQAPLIEINFKCYVKKNVIYVILQFHGLGLVNINLPAKYYQNIPNGLSYGHFSQTVRGQNLHKLSGDKIKCLNVGHTLKVNLQFQLTSLGLSNRTFVLLSVALKYPNNFYGTLKSWTSVWLTFSGIECPYRRLILAKHFEILRYQENTLTESVQIPGWGNCLYSGR